MHTYVFKKGTTDVSIELEIIDSTDGTPETGVVWNTSGIDLQYRRDGAASTAITEATLAALTTAHTDGGFLHIGNGVYRFDLPDAACASGVNKVVIHGTVTGMIVIPCVIQLVDYDPFDTVRLGLTALPNAAADAAGGLPISDAGGLDIDTKLANTNEITVARMGALTDWIDGGRLDLLLDAIKVVTDAQAATGTGLTAIPWNAAWDAEVQSEVNDGLVAFFTSAAQLVDDIMDEVITGAAHNVNNSLAKYIREAAESSAMLTGTAQSATANTLVLASGAVTADDILNGERVSILEGTGVGQSRLITDSVALTDTVTVAHNWTTNPDSTSVYGIVGAEVDIRAVAEQPVSATTTVDFDDLATILLDTAELQGDWTDAGRLDAILDSILSLLDDARAEPGQGAPPVNPDAMTKLDYLYKAWRNKKDNDGTTTNLYADDGTTVDQKQTTSSAAGTVTKAEWVTGP